jgi:hypothetical protein
MPPAMHGGVQATMAVEVLTCNDGPFNETRTESTTLTTEVRCRDHAVK